MSNKYGTCDKCYGNCGYNDKRCKQNIEKLKKYMASHCDCCGIKYKKCKCICSNCGDEYKECKNTCYE